MKLGLETLPDSARIWIYQSNRALNQQESMQLEVLASQFVSGWNAHGQKLSAGFDFLHDHFLVLAVDESVHAASGCSIDTSVALVRQLNHSFGVDFLDRTHVAVLINDKVTVLPLGGIKQAVTNGQLNKDTLVFNNLCPTLGDYRKNWLAPASETWLKRYFQ